MTYNQCPMGEVWDKFILEPDKTDQAALDRHLQGCQYCRFFVARRREQLERYASKWTELKKSGVYYLNVWQPASIQEGDLSSLAAEGKKSTDDIQSVTLLSTDQAIMLKVVRDSHTGEVWLYLISDDPALYRNVLVCPFGGSEYMTDENGRVNLGRVPWPSSENLSAEVRVARVSFSLVPIKDIPQPEGSLLLTSPDGDQIRVSLHDTGAGKALRLEFLKKALTAPGSLTKIAVREKGSKELVMVKSDQKDQMELPQVNGSDTIEIYLFS